MRKQFFDTIEKLAVKDDKIVFLTGDVGFMAIEPLQKAIGDRVINCGVAEQNMISMAAGMASQGLKPICYSIAPFVTHRVAEQLKIDVCLHNMNVKIVGNGGGYGYGIMGATHHAIEDIGMMSALQNMKCYIPYCNQDTPSITKEMMDDPGPSYLRLGYGDYCMYDEGKTKIQSGEGATVIGMGPVILGALGSNCDIFVIRKIPFRDNYKIFNSIEKTGKLVVIEEHVRRGGLGEYFMWWLVRCGVKYKIVKHLYADGYPNGLYGSQAYHQKINGLDRQSIEEVINGI